MAGDPRAHLTATRSELSLYNPSPELLGCSCHDSVTTIPNAQALSLSLSNHRCIVSVNIITFLGLHWRYVSIDAASHILPLIERNPIFISET